VVQEEDDVLDERVGRRASLHHLEDVGKLVPDPLGPGWDRAAKDAAHALVLVDWTETDSERAKREGESGEKRRGEEERESPMPTRALRRGNPRSRSSRRRRTLVGKVSRPLITIAAADRKSRLLTRRAAHGRTDRGASVQSRGLLRGRASNELEPREKHAECRERLSSFVVEVERVKEDYRTRGKSRRRGRGLEGKDGSR